MAKKKETVTEVTENIVAEAAEKPAKKTTRRTKKTAEAAEAAVEAVAAEEKPAKKTTRRTKKTVEAEAAAEAVAEEKPAKKTRRTKKTAEAEAAAEVVKEEKPAKKTTRRTKKTAEPVVEATVVEEAPVVVEAPEAEVVEIPAEVAEAPAAEAVETPAVVEEASAAEVAPAVVEEAPAQDFGPRVSIAFIGSECYPFVKTGGLGDVMYALPRILAKQNCDVRVIIPRYKCIKEQFQNKMVYRGSFQMELCEDGRSFYVGIMEYINDGVVYDFIDNEEFFSTGNPYVNLIDDIPKYCYFSKAALAALNYMNWIPDIIHCHDWQAALVPVYKDTLFKDTALSRSKTMFTIHNLRFQGIYNIETVKYWSGLPEYVFNKDALAQKWVDANMLKGGLTYTNSITTVSGTYAEEIQTAQYGEGLEEHLKYHAGKLRGIVNGIDVDIWNPATDARIPVNYNTENAWDAKRANKRALQERLGLEVDDSKMVIGLISRLTNQKGLDLVNAVIPAIMDGYTQVVVLGTGDAEYENSFREYENRYKGSMCSYIAYDENLAHLIYAGSDALLVPSAFEPCGLTQLIAMRYGTAPIVRETGGLKDTVEPYNQYYFTGNGFTFDQYDAYLLYDCINRAKTVYFTDRWHWDEMVVRDMNKDVSWDASAVVYKNLYLELIGK